MLFVRINLINIVSLIWPEAEWSNHEQVEYTIIGIGGLYPYMLHNIGMSCG